ncbi:MAG: DNA starvation/stationary phase protection protein Dps [Nostocales cyanobacterium 94392]|nr:DNA starvation/stationary phase protection protein Dps [Nostocales cyanobacterium 94392]
MSDINEKLESRLYPSHIDIPADVRREVVTLLNQTLAATADLKSQVKQAHWNVKGTDFYQLHEMFDEIAGEIEEFIDMFAERITALAGYACGTVRMAAANSILPEYPTDILDGMQHVTALVERFAAYAKHLREAIDKTDELNEQDTNDLYVEVSRTIDKRLWFLEAHIQVSEVK